jgi:uncharacterized membrane protein YqjE
MDAAQPEPPSSGTRGLSEPLLRYLEARGVLLTLEAQEALQQLMRVLIFTGVAAMAAFMGWVLLTAALLSFVMEKTGWSLMAAVTVLGAAHGVLALLFLLLVRSRLGRLRLFAETLNEFKKDRVWLASQTHKP